MQTKIERRRLAIPLAEFRAAGDGQSKTIGGYAAIFYRSGDPSTEYEVWPGVIERIHAGAFDAAMKEDDVLCLFDHDDDRILGRHRPGVAESTLRLSVDERGLKYETTLPDHELSVRSLIDRKDVDGSSFGFSVYTEYGAKRGHVVWEEKDGVQIRNIYDLQLFDVGPTPRPAYSGATAESRSLLLVPPPALLAEVDDEFRLRLLTLES